jgi:hypothetical protein
LYPAFILGLHSIESVQKIGDGRTEIGGSAAAATKGSGINEIKIKEIPILFKTSLFISKKRV